MADDYMTSLLERLGRNKSAEGITQDPYANVTPEQAKMVGGFAPVSGEAIGAYDTYNYAKEGDYLNAGISGVATLAGLPFGLLGMSGPVRQGVKTALTKAVTSLDLLKAKPQSIAKEGSDTFKVAGLPDRGEAWRKLNKLENLNQPSDASKAALKAQAEKLEAGEITQKEFREWVDTNIPYYIHDTVPEVRTAQEVAASLGEKAYKIKKKKGPDNLTGIIGLNRNIDEGKRVESRFDINAYRYYNVYTATLTSPNSGDVIGYGQTAALKNVAFPVKKGFDTASLLQAKGANKSPFVRMEGDWVNHSPEELREIAVQALEQNKNLPLAEQEWVQVGVNPAKGSSWVALEKTAEGVRTVPITGAAEVIQIGKLVLAKNPKFKSWDDHYKDFKFAIPAAGAVGVTASVGMPEESMAAQDDEMYQNPLLQDPFDYVGP
jgi:hypothetical protein